MALDEGILCVSGVDIMLTEYTTHKVSVTNGKYIVRVPGDALYIFRIQYTQLDIMDLGEDIVCAVQLGYALYWLGVYYTLMDTLTEKGYSMRGIVYIPGVSYVYLENSSLWLRALHTQLDTLTLWECILCEPEVSIILSKTQRYNEHRGKHTMCTLSIHHTNLQYTAHR